MAPFGLGPENGLIAYLAVRRHANRADRFVVLGIRLEAGGYTTLIPSLDKALGVTCLRRDFPVSFGLKSLWADCVSYRPSGQSTRSTVLDNRLMLQSLS
jgi:hypothetical protein